MQIDEFKMLHLYFYFEFLAFPAYFVLGFLGFLCVSSHNCVKVAICYRDKTSTSVGTDLYPHMPTYVHTPRHIPGTAHL